MLLFSVGKDLGNVFIGVIDPLKSHDNVLHHHSTAH